MPASQFPLTFRCSFEMPTIPQTQPQNISRRSNWWKKKDGEMIGTVTAWDVIQVYIVESIGSRD